MATVSCPSELLAETTGCIGAASPADAGDGRPMVGLAFGLLLSMPLWAGLWYVSGWI